MPSSGEAALSGVRWPARQFQWPGASACYHTSLVCLHLLAPDLPLTKLSFLFPSVSSLSTQQCFLPQSPLMFKDQMQQDVIMVLKFPSNSPVTHVAANTLPHLTIPAVVTVTCSRLFAVNRWHNTVGTWVSALATELRQRQCWGALVSAQPAHFYSPGSAVDQHWPSTAPQQVSKQSKFVWIL